MKRHIALVIALPLFGISGLHVGCEVASNKALTTHSAGEQAATPPAKPASQSTPAPPVADRSPVPVVELRGGGADLGAAHGQRLSSSIRLLHDKYLRRYIRGDAQRFLALTAADGFGSQLSPAHRAEVEAMAQCSGLDVREAMLGQCFLDLTGMVACSTITLPAAAAPDGVARFGRNLDFPSFGVADKYSTLFVVHPTGKYAFASVGWPGLIGVLSGMNEHGLTVANMEVTRPPRLPKAMPYTLLYRKVLEECRTTDDAIALLRSTPRQTSNNLMIMDASGARALAEISPDGVTVRPGADAQALISTNHRRDQDNDTAGECLRYDALHDAAGEQFGRIDPTHLEAMLAAASQGQMTLQSMVFEPSNRVLYLSAGTDAARRTFHRIELTPYFR